MKAATMKVAIDAHALGRQQAGYSTYLQYLTAELPLAAPDVQFLLYRELSANRARRLLWDLPARLAFDRPDVLHVQYVAPVPCLTPLVATIHDLSFLDVPQFFSALERTLLRIAVRRTVRLARRIVTVSEFSKRRLVGAYGLPDDQIIVAPNAAGPQFQPLPGTEASGDPYVLMVGDLQPRKNHLGAIRAFAAFCGGNGNRRDRLKIAGRDTSFAAVIRREAAVSGVGERIDFLGYVPDAELPSLYRGASCCVYPPFYEGFGLPVLEAMACGTPVVTSKSTALEEIAGTAAVLVDPGDPRDIARAMEAAIRERAALREAGLLRARAFSWKESAARTVAAFRAARLPHPAAASSGLLRSAE